MPSRTFQIHGIAVINKVKISAQAKQALQGITLNIDDKSLKNALQGVNQQVKQISSSFNKLGQAGGATTTIAKGMDNITTATVRANDVLGKQRNLFLEVLRKASAFRVSAIIINSFVDSLKNSFTAFLKFDTSLREINKIARLNDIELKKLGGTIITLAGKFNVSASDALDAFRTVSQLGFEDRAQELDFYERALKIAASSTLNLADSVNLLITVSKQGGLSIGEASAAIAQLSAIEDASAVDLKDLSEIVTKAGTSIAQAFTKATDAFGLFAAVQERTKAGGAVVGTFAKTFIARLSGSNQEVLKTFRDLNIEITDANNNLKDPIQLLLALKGVIRGLADEDVGEVLGKVFGVRQIELGKATLDSLGSEILKNGKAFELAEAAANGFTNQIFKIDQNSKKLEARLTEVKNNLLAFLAAKGEDTLVPLFDALIAGGNAANATFKELGVTFNSILKVVTLLGTAFVAKNLFNFNPRDAIKTQSDIERIATGNKGIDPTNRPNRAIITGQLFKGNRVRPIGPFGGQEKIEKINQVGLRQTPFENRLVDFGRGGKIGFKDGKLTGGKGEFSTLNSFSSPRTQGNNTGILNNTIKEIDSFGKQFITRQRRNLLNIENNLNKNALAFALALTVAGDVTRKFGNQIGGVFGDIAKSGGDAIGVFGQFLPFGAKIAAVAATLGLVSTATSRIADFISFKQGDKAAEARLRRLTGQTEHADSLDKQKVSEELIRQTNFGKKTPEGEELEKTLVQIIDGISTNIQDIKDPADRSKEAIRQLLDALTELDKQKPGTKQGILGIKNKEGFREKGLIQSSEVQRRIGNRLLANNLNSATNFSSAIGDSDTEFIKEIGSAFSILTETEKELSDIRKKVNVLSDEEIDRLKDELKLKQELSESILLVNSAQRELISSSQGLSELESLKAELPLRKQIREVNLSHLKESLDLEIQRKKAVKEEQIRSLKEDILSNKRIVERNTGLPFGENAIKGVENISGTEERKAARDALKSVEGLEEQLKKAMDTELTDRRALEEARKKLTTAENKAAAEHLQDVNKIIEAERKLSQDRLESVNSIKEAAQGLKGSVLELFSTVRDDDIVKKAQLASKLSNQAAQLKVDEIKEQIRLERELNQQGRFKEIANISAKLGGRVKFENGKQVLKDDATEEEKVLKARLDVLFKEPLKDGENIQKLFAKLAKTQIDVAKTAIDNRAKELEAEKSLSIERISSSSALITKARELKDVIKSTFEAQKSLTDAIRNKIDEAAENIKSKRGDLSSALDGLRSAREGLRNAINQAIDSNAEYSLSLAKASIEADKILGTFFGLTDQASALQSAFDAVINSARVAGASEQELARLRAESVKEQLGLFSQLLDDQRSKADKFFASSGEDRIGFIQSISSIQSIVEQFNGNIENFRNLSESQLNNFGRQLISLPQDLRAKIIGALEQLPNGVGIGGLTADNIKEVLQGGALGKSSNLGVTSISDNIQTVAELTRQSVELDRTTAIANQEQINQAQAGVEQAKEQVLIAKLALLQAQNDALLVQRAINQVTTTIDTQIGEYRAEFKAETQRIISTITDPLKRQVALAEALQTAQSKIAEVISNNASLIGSISAQNPQSVGVQTIGNVNSAAGNALINTILPAFNQNLEDLRKTLGDTVIANTTIAGSITDVVTILKDVNTKILSKEASNIEDIKADISINNEQVIRVVGAAEFADQVLNKLKEAGFLTEQDILGLTNTLKRLLEVLVQKDVIRNGEVR